MRLDELNIMRPCVRLYLFSKRSYIWANKTFDDLWWRNMSHDYSNHIDNIRLFILEVKDGRRIYNLSPLTKNMPFQRVFLKKTNHLMLPIDLTSWCYNKTSRNWSHLRPSMERNPRYTTFTFWWVLYVETFEGPGHLLVALTRWHSCKKIIWGRVTSIDLMTWLHIMC